MHPSGQTVAEYFDIVEVGVYLGIIKPVPDGVSGKRALRNQLARVYRLVATGRIPVIRMGSRLYFDKSAVDAALRSGAHQSCHQSPIPSHVLRSLQPPPTPDE